MHLCPFTPSPAVVFICQFSHSYELSQYFQLSLYCHLSLYFTVTWHFTSQHLSFISLPDILLLSAITLLPVPVDISKSLLVFTLIHLSTCCRITTGCHFCSKPVVTLLPEPAVTTLLIVTAMPGVELPLAHTLINYKLPIYFTSRYNVI
jgi:hypothetical protein